ncbi:hypothetical protein SAMN04488691_103193 [Haloferax larsenii]|uniref:Uncharacterized protein n=1 Tax=Haloferax larsenii TaxID=302484 RepID=A0A1H7N5I5_HALLR|nr:hypothetical protein SAMN04488691_103193 [Haloferax larsenii]
MHYRDAAQVIIGEATRLNEEGVLSDLDRDVFERNLKLACEILADAEKRNASQERDSQTERDVSNPSNGVSRP